MSCLYAEYYTHHTATGQQRILDLIRATFVAMYMPLFGKLSQIRPSYCLCGEYQTSSFLDCYISFVYVVYQRYINAQHRQEIKWERIFYVRMAMKGRSKNKGGRRWPTKFRGANI